MNTFLSLPRLALLVVLGSSLGAIAQSEEDALRYSNILPGGTARSWAMGGAFGAVGADAASASLNPAGFGLYNSSEFTLTPSFEVNDARSTHYGNTASASQNRFSLNNIALVLNYPNDAGKNWRGGSFGISFDRQASYNWKENAIGNSVNSSLTERFVNEANGISYLDLESDQTPLPFTGTLAWFAYAMDTVPGIIDQYASAIPFGSAVKQQHTIDASGRLSTTSFFYANNYKDKLYFGVTLGLVGVNYERHTIHNETTFEDTVDLKTFQYKEDLLTTGNGIDLKFGVIGRVTEKLRLGASFHSPKWLLLSDAYSYSLFTNFRAGDSYTENSPEGSFSYRVNTPWSVLASAVYQAGKSGIISVDYGYTDFRKARLRASDEFSNVYDFAQENDVIRGNFKGTHSLRVGTEWRSGNWYFRGGGGYFPNAYADRDPRQGTAYKMYTGGIGFRKEHFSIDLAITYGQRDTKWYQYSPALVQATSGQLTDVRSLVTVSLRP